MKKAEIHVPELLLRKNPKNPLKLYKSLINDIDYSYFGKLQNEIKAENIRNNLK